MALKEIVTCPDCGQKMRVPADKHVRFKCSTCGLELESQPETQQTEKETVPTPSRKKGSILTTILLSAVAVFVVRYFIKKDQKFIDKVDELINWSTLSEDAGNTNYIERFDSYLKEATKDPDRDAENLARQIASNSPGTLNTFQIYEIYDYVLKHWAYVNDPKSRELIESAGNTIRNRNSKNQFVGDCDDFAVMMATLVNNIGGEVRISIAQDDKNSGHAFTEVFVANNTSELQVIQKEISTRYYANKAIYYTGNDEEGYWINLDWFGRPQRPGGEYFNYVYRIVYYPFEKDKTWQIEDLRKR